MAWIAGRPTVKRQCSSYKQWRPRRARRTGSRACRRRYSGRSSTPCWDSTSTSTVLQPVEPDVFKGRRPAATACSAPDSSSTWVCSTWCSSRWTRRGPTGRRSSPRSCASGTRVSTSSAPRPRARCSSLVAPLRPQPISQTSRDRRPGRRASPAKPRSRHRAADVGNADRRRRRRPLAFPRPTATPHERSPRRRPLRLAVVGFSRYAGLRLTPAYQGDCVHVLADNGTAVEAEIEAFGFIALLATTPTPSPSRPWSSTCSRPDLEELRRSLGVPPTSPEATAAGSVRPWHPDGMSHAQRAVAASGRVPTGTSATRASEAGMTAKPCDPTTTAQEEGR